MVKSNVGSIDIISQIDTYGELKQGLFELNSRIANQVAMGKTATELSGLLGIYYAEVAAYNEMAEMDGLSNVVAVEASQFDFGNTQEPAHDTSIATVTEIGAARGNRRGRLAKPVAALTATIFALTGCTVPANNSSTPTPAPVSSSATPTVAPTVTQTPATGEITELNLNLGQIENNPNDGDNDAETLQRAPSGSVITGTWDGHTLIIDKEQTGTSFVPNVYNMSASKNNGYSGYVEVIDGVVKVNLNKYESQTGTTAPTAPQTGEKASEDKAAAEKLGVSAEDYGNYKKASDATGLSIEDVKSLSEQYGVDSADLGTDNALHDMRDTAGGERVNERLTAKTPEEFKKQITFIAYNNPAALAQYMAAVNEDDKTDKGIDGFETPALTDKLFQKYLDDHEAFLKDFAEFKEGVKDADIEIRGATSKAGYSYMYRDGKVVLVDANENSRGTNDSIYEVTFTRADGTVVRFNVKEVCAQTSVVVGSTVSKPSTPKKPVTPEKPVKPVKPVTPDKPEKPEKPVKPVTPNKPTTPEKPAPKDQSQNPVSAEKSTADNSKAESTVSNEEAKTPAGDNSGSSDAGKDTGNEKQTEEPEVNWGS